MVALMMLIQSSDVNHSLIDYLIKGVIMKGYLLIAFMIGATIIYCQSNLIIPNIDSNNIFVEKYSNGILFLKQTEVLNSSIHVSSLDVDPQLICPGSVNQLAILDPRLDTLQIFEFSTSSVNYSKYLQFPKYNDHTNLLSYAFTGDKNFKIMKRNITHDPSSTSVSILGVVDILGNIVYEKKAENNNEDYIHFWKSYTDDECNTIFVAEVKGHISLGDIEFYTSRNCNSLYVCKLSPTGELLWKNKIQNVKNLSYDFAISGNGSIYIIWKSPQDPETEILNLPDLNHLIFVLKIKSNGDKCWESTIPGYFGKINESNVYDDEVFIEITDYSRRLKVLDQNLDNDDHVSEIIVTLDNYGKIKNCISLSNNDSLNPPKQKNIAVHNGDTIVNGITNSNNFAGRIYSKYSNYTFNEAIWDSLGHVKSVFTDSENIFWDIPITGYYAGVKPKFYISGIRDKKLMIQRFMSYTPSDPNYTEGQNRGYIEYYEVELPLHKSEFYFNILKTLEE